MLITLMEPYALIFGTARPVSAVFVDDKDCLLRSDRWHMTAPRRVCSHCNLHVVVVVVFGVFQQCLSGPQSRRADTAAG